MPPTKAILDAFSLTGEPLHLTGGEGECYRVGNIVLKPTRNLVEAAWIAELNNSLASSTFRVPKFFKAPDGSWAYQGWTAMEFLAGEHRPGHYAEAVELSRKFHQALKNVPKPDWFDEKSDVFALADKMAWGELPLPEYELAKKPFEKITGRLRGNALPDQLIHGDWGPRQILFHDTLPPAVLDMTPYFRPADYPIADMMVSALDHEGADMSILGLGKGITDFDQLLLRALLFRTCTYIGFQTHPENDRDWNPIIVRHLGLVDAIVK
jgi:uncharacterized protein (TIGR02569 family)